MNELGKCGTFTYMANFSAGKDVRPICMHRELSPKISTNDSITSLQASRIMSCGITVSPSGNHLPVHTGSTGLEWLWLRRRCCTTAAAKFHQGEEAFSSTSSQTICVSRGRKTKTAVWQETFVPFQEPSQLSWKLRSLSLWQRRGWQNKLYEETHRSNLD